MQPKRKLADILQASESDRIGGLWATVKPADDLGKPIPAGEYRCRVVAGELFTSKSGTPGYKITFKVSEGEHARRRLWQDVWLTEAAMAMAKRDLMKLGIESVEQLDRELPEGLIASVKVSIRKDDDGTERNRIVTFEIVAIEKPEADPFAPPAEAGLDEQDFDWCSGRQVGPAPAPERLIPPTRNGAYSQK